MAPETFSDLKKSKNYDKLIEKMYNRKFRALKIIHNLSEFLKALSINEGDILKSMLIKFACEAIDSTRGSLLMFDPLHNEFYHYDTSLFLNGRPVLKDFNDLLKEIKIPSDYSYIGEAFKRRTIILIPESKKYKGFDSKIDNKLEIKPRSLIAVPLIVDNELIAILEIVNDKTKDDFDNVDVESIRTITNIASATMENAKLFRWAISDGLTQIYNVHFFKRLLEQEIKKTNRYGGTISIIMLDLDNFKKINDTYGHQIGDKVLQKLSDIIRNNIRLDIDIPGRYGGDEFIVFLPSTDIKGAAILSERLLRIIQNSKIDSNSGTLNFSSSIGVVEYKKNSSLEQFVEAVDKAMYNSKKNGRNRITVLNSY